MDVMGSDGTFSSMLDTDGSTGTACFKSPTPPPSEDDSDLRRGPWTVEEDLILMNYITAHGEGRWNSLARCAGTESNTYIHTYIHTNCH